MDFRVADGQRRRRNRRLLFAAGGVAGIVAALSLLGHLSRGALAVERSAVWTGVVERGEMRRQIRGPGSLQVPPEQIRWLVAETPGRVEERRALPGTAVTADTVLLVLSNPELEQQTRVAELQLRAQEAELRRLVDHTRSALLEQQSTVGQRAASAAEARRRADADRQLFEAGLVGELIHRRSEMRAEELELRRNLEKERLSFLLDSREAQFASKEATVARHAAVVELRRRQLAALTVRAGRAGILIEAPVEVGEEVTAGQKLARVADPQELKAVLRIAETQARDIAVGQPVAVDTRNGVVGGVVSRVDPAVRDGTVSVDVRLEGTMPSGARPGLSVDGTIELDRIADTLHVGRPAYGQPESTVGLFRVSPDGQTAVRVPVALGRGSVNRIEILTGLVEGDEIILSDTSGWDTWDSVRFR